eukprot:scaffold41902_cov78-Skeletonema_dohrnii-CCMP3373.AAC.2
MSGEEKSENMMCCASCGIAKGDDIQLKKCAACYLVRYCSVECQKDHRPKHKKECKKRAAELHDEILFKQPDSSHYGDCPICLLPLPIDERKIMMHCCSKLVCKGCCHANRMREIQGFLEEKCPFCRTAAPQKGDLSDLMKRVEANDPMALYQMGLRRHEEGDYACSFEYYTKAAVLGDVDAHWSLSCMYREGVGVEKDEKREVYHLEQAAIGGSPFARNNIGAIEMRNGRLWRAIKHWIIGAKLGNDHSLGNLKKRYREGLVSKEDFAAALHGHQAAVDATKSPQREMAQSLFE